MEKKLDAARACITNRSHLQTRLQTIFTSNDRSTFYTKIFDKEKLPSLVLCFDNGIDPDPDFSGMSLAKIHLDSQDNLCLTTWPTEEKENLPWRTEILQKQIKSFDFEFLGQNSALEQGFKEKIIPINPNFAWRGSWPKSMQKTPNMIRMNVYEQGRKDPVQYAFILPISECITYSGAL